MLVGLPIACIRALILLVLTHSIPLVLAVMGAWLVLVFLAGFAAPADLTRTTRPVRTLRNDRGASVYLAVLNMASAVLAWLFFGPVIALAVVVFLVIAQLYEMLLGTMIVLAQPSDLFSGTRIVLACMRRMPLRTMTFLADAQRRGVLRQSGAAYRFRHVRLRQRLAQMYTGRADQIGAALLGRADDYVRGKRKNEDGLPWSNAPLFGAVWAHRFAEAAAAVQDQVGVIVPAGRAYQAGPGIARRYTGDDGRVWAMSALPSQRPVLVAGQVWQALWQAAGEAAGHDELKALGLPWLDGEVGAGHRIIAPEVVKVSLHGGSWGAGAIVREAPAQPWRWITAPGLDVSNLVGLSYQGWNKPCIQVLTTVTIQWDRAYRRVVRQLRDQAISLLADGSLTRAADALAASRPDSGALRPAKLRPLRRGFYPRQFGREYVFRNEDGERALAAMTGLMWKPVVGRLTAEARVQLFRAWQEGGECTGEEIAALLSAGWDTCVALLSLATRVALGGGTAGLARVTLSLTAMDPKHAAPELPLAEIREARVTIRDTLRLSPEQREAHIRQAVVALIQSLDPNVQA